MKQKFDDTENTAVRQKNTSGLKKRIISIIQRMDDRQLQRLYEFAHRMTRDWVD